ncbi:cation-translocating P-type ATPase [Natrinema caseinilyticum]|uniref:cation-translocating P-type ATPase n=1 Tax=Natrinema caseinilyticum TaxID=2961570 RepID=UPI0020C26DD0|nr:cation-transporting P-type ATPase [Natrinema caseinilyticum]
MEQNPPRSRSIRRVRGLSHSEAAKRLRRDGPNVLPTQQPPPAWRLLAEQFVHFFAIMLWVASGLAVVAGMMELGIAIVLVVVINGLFAFAQEYRAERAAERLRDLLPKRATVRRDGTIREIDATELVVDDVVLLGPGDRVSADLEIVDSHSLQLDVSLLTGESDPEPVEEGETAYAGTFVVEGEATGVVRATGSETRLGEIAALTRARERPETPLHREIDRLVRIIAAVAVAVGGVFFAVSVALGTDPSVGILFAIGVTVALVPEGLLPSVTMSLAVGAKRLAADNALVRRLESVETLGSTTFICTDKTGTLTQNRMAVVEAWTPAGTAHIEGDGYDPTGTVEVGDETKPLLRELGTVVARCSTGDIERRDGEWVAHGDPMEAALVTFARRLDVDIQDQIQTDPEVKRFPFDPRRRRTSVLTQDQLLVMGAPEAVIERTRHEAGDVQTVVAEMAERGLRVLAVATRPANEVTADADLEAIETDLELVGVVGLEDPPRPGVAAAVTESKNASVRTAMITGDHPTTARAIAEEVGLVGDDGLVIDGDELPDDDQMLGALLDRDGVVVSRVSPEDKLLIAHALQDRGHVVAMTGDGVNDGPALQEADVGVAMGRSGTDVAREAADLVLLDDDFETIVNAIRQGRATFYNIKRFLTYHLTDNVAQLTPFVVWALAAGQFPLALGILQILALDIGTDLLPALALGSEPPAEDVLEQPLEAEHLIDETVLGRAFGVLGPAEATVEMTAFVVSLAAFGWVPGGPFPEQPELFAASGAAFTAVVVGQMANAFACRSTTHWPGELGWTSNRLLVGAVIVELLALLAFLFVGPIARILGQAPPPLEGGLVALLASPVLLVVDSIHKRWRARY